MSDRDLIIVNMRKVTGLSQARFAELLDIPVANIQKWEQGVSAPPDYVKRLIYRDLQHRGYPI